MVCPFFCRTKQKKKPMPPIAHTPAQLELANACHSAMRDDERWKRLMYVARRNHDAQWTKRLRVTADSHTAPPSTAMAMLDAYERRPRSPSDPSYPSDRSDAVPVWVRVLVVLVVLVVVAVTMVLLVVAARPPRWVEKSDDGRG